MSNNKGKLIILSAPSGTGKSSLIKEIILNSSGDIQLSVSATTRLPRDGEVHGKDYFFISVKEFDELKENNSFTEYANVHGHHYGTLKSFVDEKIENGISMILDIDVQGFDQIKDSIQNSISIFIIPPSIDELKNRLISRGLDLDEVIEKRLINAKEELKYAELYDHIVLNDEFDKALNQINSIIFGMNHYDNNEINANLLRDLLD